MNKEDYRVKDISWIQSPFKIDSLSDQPFDLLNTLTSLPSSPSTHEDNDTILSDRTDDIWTEYTPSPTSFHTLSWDTHPSHITQHIISPFLTEIPTVCYESLLQPTLVIKEDRLVKALIQSLLGLSSVYFRWKDHMFDCYPSLRISGVSHTTIQPMLTHLLQFSTQLKLIEEVGNHCRSHPDQYGSIGVSFGCCISELYMNIQHRIINVFNTIKDMSLLKIYHHTYSLSVIIDRIAQLCQIQTHSEDEIVSRSIKKYGFYIPSGVHILNRVYDEIHNHDLYSGEYALYRHICLSIFGQICQPYMNILNQWLGLSSIEPYCVDIQDPYNEFFIQKSTDIDPLYEYEISPHATLPHFITPDMSITILRASISLRLLKKLGLQHPVCHIYQSMPLQCIYDREHSQRYLNTLKHTCQHIQHYNRTKTEYPEEVDDKEVNNEYRTHTSDILSIQPLSDPTINGPFSVTLEYLMSNDIPTLDTIIHHSFITPISLWCPLLNTSFMLSFIRQFRLDNHLNHLYNYYLCGNGRFSHGLVNTFYSQHKIDIHVTHWPPLSSSLNIALKTLLLDNNEEMDMSFSIRKDHKLTVVGLLDFLQLDYTVEYPVDMVITPTIEHKYNQLFLFLLRLIRMNITLNRCYKISLTRQWQDNKIRDIIFRYRYQFSQFIHAIQSYIHDTAITSNWNVLSKYIHSMQHSQYDTVSVDYLSVIMEPHALREYHEHILDRMMIMCFLKYNQKRVLDIIHVILGDILMFMAVLDSYNSHMDGDRLLMKCNRIYDQFQTNVKVLVRVLVLLDDKGFGNLSHLLNEQKYTLFNELYRKHEAKSGIDSFIQDLLMRLQLNGFYDER